MSQSLYKRYRIGTALFFFSRNCSIDNGSTDGSHYAVFIIVTLESGRKYTHFTNHTFLVTYSPSVYGVLWPFSHFTVRIFDWHYTALYSVSDWNAWKTATNVIFPFKRITIWETRASHERNTINQLKARWDFPSTDDDSSTSTQRTFIYIGPKLHAYYFANRNHSYIRHVH